MDPSHGVKISRFMQWTAITCNVLKQSNPSSTCTESLVMKCIARGDGKCSNLLSHTRQGLRQSNPRLMYQMTLLTNASRASHPSVMLTPFHLRDGTRWKVSGWRRL